MSIVITDNANYSAIAQAIRAKNGSNTTYRPDQMAAAIQAIQTGGNAPVLQSKVVSPSTSAQTVRPDSGYDGLSQVTVNAIQTETKTATPSESSQNITPSSGKYLTRVTVNPIDTTYVGSSVPRKAAATITPGTADQTIAAGQYLSGAQTIKGDANLTAGNIRKGASIFGVSGSYEGSGGGGGVVVQTATGSITANGSSSPHINIDCGFTPDLLVFTLPDAYTENGQPYVNDICINMAALAIGETATGMASWGELYTTYYNTGVYVIKRNGGFEFFSAYESEPNGNFWYSTKTYGYTAIKYT